MQQAAETIVKHKFIISKAKYECRDNTSQLALY